MIDFDLVCFACKAGLHAECSTVFNGTLPDGQECCCNGEYTLFAHLNAVRKAEFAEMAGEPRRKEHKSAAVKFEPEAPRGNSGYIHPDAWPSDRDIGSLTEAASTGRKRATAMFPLSAGQVCDWARRANCGGGPRPVVGCMGSPASDLHHGPDKNTLNNQVARRGVGDTDNLWFICSECHNAWHAANDPFYPPYDRDEQQASPWIPHTDEPWGGHEAREATEDELLAEDRRREERRKQRGRKTRGRNADPRIEPDITVRKE